MKPTEVTTIALGIVLLTIAFSALVWTVQSETLTPDLFMNGLGIGCAFAAIWVVIAVAVNMFRPRRR
jgi:hypothetical protein